MRGARRAIASDGEAFGAEQELLIEEPDGRIGQAMLRIGPVGSSRG